MLQLIVDKLPVEYF